ncbi:MAG TPA: hypothetical protein PKJ00_11255 [Verrucomicrobiota bacterium]|nr:hypothetical protein [Verrucomicrobiota bacterium]HNS69511.1 hypothetical protein [Verrucomicrobiota bacterium]
MILDIGQLGGMIQMTADFSNAVLVAMLPYVSNVTHQLNLPVPQPIAQQVVGCGVLPYLTPNGEMLGCGIKLKGNWAFGFHSGYLDRFESPHAYYGLQNPSDIPKFFGTVRMTQDEAVQMARATLTNLGVSLEAVFAEQEPRVTPPPKVRTHIVPHYRIEWIDPRVDHRSVDIEVNAEAKRVERIAISPNASLRRPWPKFGVVPVIQRKRLAANPEYAWKLLPIALRAVDEYTKAIGLPVPRPLSSNHVARFEVSDNGGWPHSEIELTNGWRFVYRNSMVNGYYAPDTFFASDNRPIRIKEFVGKSKISEVQAIALIRRTLSKADYPTNLVQMGFKPQVVKPTVPGIPRWAFWWNLENETRSDLISKVEAEVDMERGELKSLYFDNIAFWNKPPPIDVPIAAPRVGADSQPSTLQKPRPKEPPPPRPQPRGTYRTPN